MAYRFEPDEAVAEAFVRTTGEELGRAQTQLTDKLEADPATSVHNARNAIKKERSLLRLMRDAVDRGERRRANAALRHAARRLSDSRDAEAMIVTLDDLAWRYVGQVPHETFTAVRTRLQEEGDRNDAASVSSAAAAAAAEIAAVGERISGWELRRGGWRAIDGGLTRTYKRGTEAFRQARRHPDDATLHAWRKRAKDLWYELRLLAPACGEAVHGGAKDAHRLADLLGDDHDLAVLRRALGRVGADVPADVDAVLGLLEHRRGELQAEAMLVGARVYAETPKAFRRRLHRTWQAGREQRHEAERRRPVELAEATRPAHALS